MSINLLVDFEEFWSSLRADIAAARESVMVQTFAFEGDRIGSDLAAVLLGATAPDKRVLIDSFSRIVLSDRFRYSPTNFLDRALRSEAEDTAAMLSRLSRAGIKIQYTNSFGPTPRRLLSRNHKKLIVIDGRIAYIGGINFSEHNAAWHDMMLRIEDPAAAAFLGDDFESTWHGADQIAHRQFAEVELLAADGRHNRLAFQKVIDLIDSARESIFVESPYVTFPFYERLRHATRRGVAVTIVTPEQNNWRLFANYARLESARSAIDLRLFTNGMSHLKAMLIDNQYLIAGSSNFDYLSYRIHQELIAVFTRPDVVADFRTRVLIADLANSRAVPCDASAISKQWLSWQTRLLDAAMEVLT
jgi:cardiolipin synthase